MEGQISIPIVPAASVNTPTDPKQVMIFIDSADANKLKVKKSDGTTFTAAAGGSPVEFA